MHPAIVRHVVLPLHERLLSRPTLTMLAALERSQWLAPAELAALQTEKLRDLFRVAAANIPFWRDRLADIDVTNATPADLARIPTLTRADLRTAGSAATWPGVPGGLTRGTTGGSTGEPLAFFTDRARQAADQAARARSRRWFGIEPGERELYLWGSPVEQSRQDRLKSLRDRLVNHRLLNAFTLSPDRLRDYVTEIARYNPVQLFGYPSTLAELARFAIAERLTCRAPALRGVFVTGETLLPADREAIARWCGAPVWNCYGARDAGFVAHECPHGRMHMTADSLLVELLDPHHDAPAEAGKVGEVVVTHLDARGMPFIRYRTGDLAVPDPRACPCGRGLPLLATIEGRRSDLLRRADGGSAHALSVIYVLRDEPAVRRFRIVQQENRDLVVSVVPAGEIDGPERSRIAAALSRQLGGVGVDLRLVSDLPNDPSGKFRYVTSEAS